MAKRGRPRKRPELKVVKGIFDPKKNIGGKEEKKGKPVLIPEKPNRPPHLDKLEAGIWDELVVHLNKIGSLQKCDEGTLVAYCSVYARLIRSRQELEKHRKKEKSDFYKTESTHGMFLRAHPAISIIEKCEKTIRSLAVEFGMTPAGRKGLGYDPSQPLLPFDEPKNTNPKDPTSGLCS